MSGRWHKNAGKKKIYISKHYLDINIYEVCLQIRKKYNIKARTWIERLQNKK